MIYRLYTRREQSTPLKSWKTTSESGWIKLPFVGFGSAGMHLTVPSAMGHFGNSTSGAKPQSLTVLALHFKTRKQSTSKKTSFASLWFDKLQLYHDKRCNATYDPTFPKSVSNHTIWLRVELAWVVGSPLETPHESMATQKLEHLNNSNMIPLWANVLNTLYL